MLKVPNPDHDKQIRRRSHGHTNENNRIHVNMMCRRALFTRNRLSVIECYFSEFSVSRTTRGVSVTITRIKYAARCDQTPVCESLIYVHAKAYCIQSVSREQIGFTLKTTRVKSSSYRRRILMTSSPPVSVT